MPREWRYVKDKTDWMANGVVCTYQFNASRWKGGASSSYVPAGRAQDLRHPTAEDYADQVAFFNAGVSRSHNTMFCEEQPRFLTAAPKAHIDAH